PALAGRRAKRGVAAFCAVPAAQPLFCQALLSARSAIVRVPRKGGGPAVISDSTGSGGTSGKGCRPRTYGEPPSQRGGHGDAAPPGLTTETGPEVASATTRWQPPRGATESGPPRLSGPAG